MKKYFLLTLMLLLTASAFAVEEVEINGLWYEVNTETNKAKVIKYKNNFYNGDIVIPETVVYEDVTYNVSSIGDDAFHFCSGLTSVTIPNSMTSIGAGAFGGCIGLTSVTIPSSVTSIGGSAFSGCKGLTSVTIPNSVTSIGGRAFAVCSGLTSITIPNSVKSIGEGAFEGCSGLTSVTIPSSVMSIGNSAFFGCNSLTTIVVENGNSVYDSRDGCNAIISTKDNELIVGCNYSTIPNTVTSIGSYAFGGCSYLTSITIPNSVTSIGRYGFYECSNLTSITFPSGLSIIGAGAFCSCSRLESVTIPNSVTYIDWDAFAGCNSLTSITIPENVTFIGGRAFNCKNLTSVTSLVKFPCRIYGKDTGCSTFDLLTLNSVTLYVPAGTKENYEATEGWKEFLNIEEMETSEYQLTYMVDGAEYKKYSIKEGETITPEPSPTKEGYTFSGWSNIPTTMPANDVTVTGSFSKNTYKLTYMVDGQVYKTVSYEYGAAIATVAAPTKEGYTFSGWSNTLLTMPARDVTISGTFSKNASSTYTLTYWVDGKEYKSVDYAPGAIIMAEPAPTKEGYEFSGWSNLPKTMPERDVTVTGSFSKKSYGNEDITKVIALILKGNATAEEMARYDMNHDGELNIGDIILIKRAMMENKVNGK